MTLLVQDTPGPCGGPLQVKGVTTNQCMLTWNAPQNHGGSFVTHYLIEKRDTSRVAWSFAATDVKETEYTVRFFVNFSCNFHCFMRFYVMQVKRLLKNNEYKFRVLAVNKFGVGVPLESVAIVAKNPYSPPDTPPSPKVSLKQMHF